MKILLFCENYRKGGLDTFLVNLINHWPDNEVSLMINSSHEGLGYLRSKVVSGSLIVTNLFSRHSFFKNTNVHPLKKIFVLIGKLFFLLISYPIQLFQLIRLFSKYKNFDELMIVNGGYPGGQSCNVASIAWFLVNGKKSWYNFHNNAQKYRRLFKPFQFISDVLVSWTTIEFISVSNDCANSMHCRTGINDRKLGFIYNGISEPSITVGAASLNMIRTQILNSPKKRVVMLGTYEERKGHEFAFAVMKQLPQYDFLVCGKGSEAEIQRINRMACGCDNIFLLGHRTDNHHIIATADLLLVPSMYNESFGLTIIEAMALNVPVIATRIGGMQEVITERWDGLLVDYGDISQLKASVIELIENVEFRREIASNAINSFKTKYSADKMALAYKNKLDTKRVR